MALSGRFARLLLATPGVACQGATFSASQASSIRWASTGAKKPKAITTAKESKATKTTKADKADKADKAAKSEKEDKPKKPLTAYINFSVATRPSVAASNPQFKFTDIGRELGARWRKLSDEEKAKWK